MKNLKTIALTFVVALGTLASSAQNKKIDTQKSNIHWIGKKITGQHEGTIKFSEGYLLFKGKKLTGGNFVVDMNSITVTDLKGDSKANLEGHLKADDFFGTDKFESSTLAFKKIADKGKGIYTITGDLTIKGITNPITFDLNLNENSGSSSLKVDRTKYGIKYGSGSFFDNLGNKAIYDDFELNVNLVF